MESDWNRAGMLVGIFEKDSLKVPSTDNKYISLIPHTITLVNKINVLKAIMLIRTQPHPQASLSQLRSKMADTPEVDVSSLSGC